MTLEYAWFSEENRLKALFEKLSRNKPANIKYEGRPRSVSGSVNHAKPPDVLKSTTNNRILIYITIEIEMLTY
jgi:hypothetical protein